jgi:nucleotidyltransferase substrate binding protein (TIGR01987 family)
METQFKAVDKAIANLREATQQTPRNDLERDGVIQRFEYSFELVWKISKRVLASMGIQSLSPKSVIRDLAAQGLIANPELWFTFLQARNYTSHTYNESAAQWVHSMSKDFMLEAEILVEKLKRS